MLKPLHIICLFILLSVGLYSCEQEDIDSDTFVIKEISEYNTSDYYTDSTVYNCFSPPGKDYDWDNNSISEFRCKLNTSSIHCGIGFVLPEFHFYLQLLDSTIYVSCYDSAQTIIYPHKLNDIINEDLIWRKLTTYGYQLYKFGPVCSGNSPNNETWNKADTTAKYIAIKKEINGENKYGFVKMPRNYSWYLGPVVFQK